MAIAITQYRNRVSAYLYSQFGIERLGQLTMRQRDYINHCHKQAAPVDDCCKALACMIDGMPADGLGPTAALAPVLYRVAGKPLRKCR